MADATELTKAIKKAAGEMYKAKKPVEIRYGTVVSASPLQIQMDQKSILGTDKLVLARNVTDYTMTVTVDWATESSSGGSGEAAYASHSHAISGSKTITVHNGLAVGDKVLMLRQQEGQKFIVVDRLT